MSFQGADQPANMEFQMKCKISLLKSCLGLYNYYQTCIQQLAFQTNSVLYTFILHSQPPSVGYSYILRDASSLAIVDTWPSSQIILSVPIVYLTYVVIKNLTILIYCFQCYGRNEGFLPHILNDVYDVVVFVLLQTHQLIIHLRRFGHSLQVHLRWLSLPLVSFALHMVQSFYRCLLEFLTRLCKL